MRARHLDNFANRLCYWLPYQPTSKQNRFWDMGRSFVNRAKISWRPATLGLPWIVSHFTNVSITRGKPQGGIANKSFGLVSWSHRALELSVAEEIFDVRLDEQEVIECQRMMTNPWRWKGDWCDIFLRLIALPVRIFYWTLLLCCLRTQSLWLTQY